MKHPIELILLLFISILLSVLTGCTSTAAEPAQETTNSPGDGSSAETGSWSIVLQKNIDQPMRVAAFLNQTFGLTGGPSDAGRAYYTTNGGQTWTLAESSTDCLFGLDIVDTDVVWQCSLGPVSLSTDSGQTWQAVTDYGNYCRNLSFVDAQTGWLAAPDQIGATIDGGATWQDVTLPAGVREILAISLRTPTHGYLLDITSILYITPNRGQSWFDHPLALDLGNGAISNHDTASAAIRFFDADRGLVVLHLSDGPQSRVIASRTTDGGLTWTQEPVINTSPFISLYLSPDGSTLTIADKIEPKVTVLRYNHSGMAYNE